LQGIAKVFSQMDDISNNKIERSPLKVLENTLSPQHLGKWFTDALFLAFRIKPAIDDNVIMIEALPKLQILDASSKKEYYKFETSTTFCFSGRHSRFEIIRHSYYVAGIAVNEFNEALKNTESTMALGRQLGQPTFTEIESMITKALHSDQYKYFDIRPNWKIPSTGSEQANETIINSLPLIPPCKQFYYTGLEHRPDNKPTTPEGNAVTKLMLDNVPTDEDLKIIQEAINFYTTCLPMLAKIDLTIISDVQAKKLIEYLRYVLSTQVHLIKDLPVQSIYRVTNVATKFLENGKVRDTKYLTHPTKALLKEQGTFNRASSPCGDT